MYGIHLWWCGSRITAQSLGVERRRKGSKGSRDASENHYPFFYDLPFVIRSFSILCVIPWWSNKSVDLEIGPVIPPKKVVFVHPWSIPCMFSCEFSTTKSWTPPCLPTKTRHIAQFVVELGRKNWLCLGAKRLCFPFFWISGWGGQPVFSKSENLDIRGLKRKGKKNMFPK